MSALEKEVTNIPWWPGLAHIFKEKYITSDIFSIHKHFLNTAHLPILVLTSVTQHYTITLLHWTAQQAEITHYWIFMLKSKKLLKSLAVWEGGNRYMFSSWDNENEKNLTRGQIPQWMTSVTKMASALRNRWIQCKEKMQFWLKSHDCGQVK